MDFYKYRAKLERNKATYLPILSTLLVGIGIFFLFQLYQRWNTYDILNRICLGAIGVGFILTAISRAFRKLAAALFFLFGLVMVLYVALSKLWTGGATLDASYLWTLILCIVPFGALAIFFFRKALDSVGRIVVPIESVDLMDGPTFEYFCAQLLSQNGFKNVQLMGGSGDQGVDIIAQKHGIRYAIQCKCYSGNLDNTPVQEVFTGMAYYRCTAAAVMTNRYFTKGGIDLANSTGVFLWDRDWIYAHLQNGIKRPKKTGVYTEGAAKLEHPDLLGNGEFLIVDALEVHKRTEPKAKKSTEPKPLTEEEILRIQGEELKWRRSQRTGGSENDELNT